MNAINLDIFFSRYVLHNLAAAVPIDIPVEFDVGAGPVGAVDGASGESETLPLDGDVSMSPSFSGAIFVLARFVILLEKVYLRWWRRNTVYIKNSSFINTRTEYTKFDTADENKVRIIDAVQ